VDLLVSSHCILALAVAAENFTFISGIFVISYGTESLSIMAVALWDLRWVVALTVASRDLKWVLFLLSFCRDTPQNEDEVRGRLKRKKWPRKPMGSRGASRRVWPAGRGRFSFPSTLP